MARLPARNSAARRDSIVALLKEQGDISVEYLSRHFGTSEVTIRKDLSWLERQGVLIRRYGGAALLTQESDALAGQRDGVSATPLKCRIAQAARARIQDHARIVIDSGSTTRALISELADINGLKVMTNSLEVASQVLMLPNHPSLLMTGGTWDEGSRAFQGQTAEAVLRSYDFDQLFVGADGIDAARGSTTFNELLTLSRVMAEVSNEVILMAEAAKVGRRMPNVELGWENIDVLITDSQLEPAQHAEICSHDVEIVMVEHPPD